MSEASKPAEPKSKKSNSRIWIALSMLLSVAIVLWAFSLPFRSGGSLLRNADPSTISATNVVAEDSVDVHASGEEFRAAAIAMDREFMKARRERTRLREVPGRVEVKRQWNRRLQQVRRQLKELGDPKEGSLQWQERKELRGTLDDAPL